MDSASEQHLEHGAHLEQAATGGNSSTKNSAATDSGNATAPSAASYDVLAGSGPAAAGKRVLEVRVEEATGSNKQSMATWDSELKEGFVKAEVRGPQGNKPIKASTKNVKVSSDFKMVWKEPLYLDIVPGSSELRLLLCRDKVTDGRRSTSVVTACGIYVKDIIDAVPIDKYFEMFKPGSGAEGGFVRLKMRLLSVDDVERRERELSGSNRRGFVKPLLYLTVLGTAGLFMKQKFLK